MTPEPVGYQEKPPLGADDDESSTGSTTSPVASVSMDPLERSSQHSKGDESTVDTSQDILGVDKAGFHLITCSRVFFIAFLAAAAASLTFVVFITLQRNEQANFETQVSRKFRFAPGSPFARCYSFSSSLTSFLRLRLRLRLRLLSLR